VLLCKETCRQPFKSYRLVGGGNDPGIILRTSVDMTCKRTVLANSNLALLSFAVETMGSHPALSMSFMRGRGEKVSKRIRDILRLIVKVYKLWTGEIKNLSEMPGFERKAGDDERKAGDDDSDADADADAGADADFDADDAKESAERHGGKSEEWRLFCAEVEARELSEEQAAISFVLRYRSAAPETLDMLKKKLKIDNPKRIGKGEGEQADSDPETENEECTILLSTVHGAKGLEWDTVEVLDDLAPLAAFRVDVPKNSNTPTGSLWCPEWDDLALNLW
jgi:hypothetical protein